MLIVYVDRDSVAMGDDVDSHVQRWEFGDDVRIGEVVVRMAHGYLAGVAGPVAWTIHVGDVPVVTQNAEYQTVSSAEQKELALVIADGTGVSIAQLHRRWGGRDLLRDASTPNAAGEYFVRARYLSAGAPVPLTSYREWVAKSDAQIDAENAAFRARAYPRLYDENGNRRKR